jgi:putative polymerase
MQTTQADYRASAAIGAPAFPRRWVAAVLVASVCYLSILSFINAQGIRVSAAHTGLFEALIYLGCLGVMLRRLPMSTVAFACFAFAWIIFAWLIRQSIDIKGMRDLIIPIIFLSLGRHVTDVAFADRSLKLILAIVAAVGLFEIFFVDNYARLFNTFSFYVNTGGIAEGHAMYEGQLLTLNGLRPEGIGRTILPFLLGSHRASSVLMEPVGLGNFAVIVLAWLLSKPWPEIRANAILGIGVALLITLCDSRFGLMMSAVLLTARLLPENLLGKLASVAPLLALGIVVGVAAFLPSDGDNVLGRITMTGRALLDFDWPLLLGLDGPLPPFGDMGYAYLLSRFGAPLSIALIAALFMIPMSDQRGIRFRAFAILYLVANLSISGTSVFALKTAGILWFLFGVLSAAQNKPEELSEEEPGFNNGLNKFAQARAATPDAIRT